MYKYINIKVLYLIERIMCWYAYLHLYTYKYTYTLLH